MSELPNFKFNLEGAKGWSGAAGSAMQHTVNEHGTILKFAEDVFGLPRLAVSDTRANSPDDAFDFSQSARKFVPIKAP